MASTPIDLPGLARLLAQRAAGKRVVMAIAGPPGSGKSMLADELAMLLGSGPEDRVAVLPMDGFHYDDTLLNALGRRARKGAPDTFDVAGLRSLLGRPAQERRRRGSGAGV